jgi:hypothetical protein
MQPTYFPWLGYFDLIANSKDFIFLDNVKFNKSSYHHQNKILGANGVVLLSVPTFTNKGRMGTLINEVEIDDSKKWRKKHLSSIEQSYRNSPYYDDIYPHIKSIISSDITNLSELNIKIIKLFASMLSLDTKFHIASHIENSAQDKVKRLVDFCKIQQCNSYYSPAGSLDYLDKVENKILFDSADIDIYFQQFEIIPYPQRQQEFMPYISALDALMYCGAKETRNIIQKGSHKVKLK